MKLCMDTNCKRKGIELDLNEFHVNRARPDGHNPYCKPCTLRKRSELYARKRVGREAQRVAHKAALELKRKQMVKAKPSPVEIVKGAIERGSRTRNTIRSSTQLPWDAITESLVELVFDAQTVRIERVGELAYFVPIAA